MRIGVNARLLIKHRLEGIGWHTYEIITRLIALNPKHTFYLFYDRKENIIIPKNDNVRAVLLFPPSRHPILISAWMEYSVRKACIDHHINLFYSPEVLMPATLHIPCIITVHDLSPIVIPESLPWSHRIYYQYIIKRNLKLADRILTVSKFSKEEIISRCEVQSSKIEVIYNAPRKIFKPIAEKEKEQIAEEYTQGMPFFIYVGSIHQRKNIDKVIAGYNAFRQQNTIEYKLILAGKFMGLSTLAVAAIKKSPYQSDIICTGYLTDERLASLVGSSAALINLSEYEGFGMPLVEAFASWIPVVAADRSSYPEIGGSAVLLVDPSKPLEIAEALNRSLTDRERLIAAGLNELNRFDWDLTAARISSIINAYQ